MILQKFLKYCTPTIKLLLYLELMYEQDVNFFYKYLKATGYNREVILSTRCAYLTLAFQCLFRGKNSTLKSSLTDNSNVYYEVNVNGFSQEQKPTKLGHIFILMLIENQWYKIDSYINYRSVQIQPVTLNQIMQFLNQNPFQLSSWNSLFNCVETDHDTKSLKFKIHQFTYTTNIHQNFHQLIKQAQHRLFSQIGRQSKLLYFLDEDCRLDSAQSYISHLKNI